MVWTGLLQLAGLMPTDTHPTIAIDAGAQAVLDTALLASAIRELVIDSSRRQQLRDEIEHLVAQSDEMLGRWAPVMLTVDAYAEVVDRHVELAGDLAWLGSLLDHLEPPDNYRRWRMGRSHSPIRVEGEVGAQRLTDTLVSITQLAERLDRKTLEFALRIVPIDWWARNSERRRLHLRPI